jgi:kumamolisin
MAKQQQHVRIAGSDHAPHPEALRGEPVSDDAPVRVTVLARRRLHFAKAARPAGDHKDRRHLTRVEFRDRYGADPEDLDRVIQALKEYGLRTADSNVSKRTVVLTGTAAAANAAFEVRLAHYSIRGRTAFRGYDGPAHIPAAIADLVEGVFGLDNRPLAKPHFVRARKISARSPRPRTARVLSAVDVTAAYKFPPGTSGAGQTIGLIELAGTFLQSDIDAYFATLHLAPPTIVSVGSGVVDTDADVEVALDIEIAGGCAPGATIVVYFAASSSTSGDDFLETVTTAVHDSVNNPTVISISWGQSEDLWTSMQRSAMDSRFVDASAMGITICAASGDNGASDDGSDGLAHVDFPASSPHVLACGGTELDLGGQRPLETVWNEGWGFASGGGISDVFPVPSYQLGVSMPAAVNPGAGLGRGVPDVAGNAAGATGYNVFVHGGQQTVGGTSAVSPMWAALVACLNQALGAQIGFLNPQLYALRGNGVFNDITSGNNDVGGDNGGYSAAAGWDCCTGLGTPLGSALLGNLSASQLSLFFPPNKITCGYSDSSSRIFIDKPYAADLTIEVKSDDLSVLAVQSLVLIQAGSTSAPVTMMAPAINGAFLPKFVGVHAMYANKTLSIAAEVVPPRVVSVVLAPSTVSSGQSSKATVGLDRASLAGDVNVDLLNGAPGFATLPVPPTLKIPQGKMSADFTITTPAMSVPFSPAEASIMAIYRSSNADSGSSASATLTVQPTVVAGILKSLVLNPTTVTAGGYCRGTVTLIQAVPTPTVVGLAALEPLAVGGGQLPLATNASTIASVPASVTIPAGQTSAQFSVTTNSNFAPNSIRKVNIMAGAVGIKTASLSVSH